MDSNPIPRHKRPERRAYQKAWNKKQTKTGQRKAKKYEYLRRHLLKKKYGITPEDYDEMLKEQGGKCAICLRPPKTRRLAVDHCHKTGKVRGLLCFKCNYVIGYHADNAELFLRTYHYLEATLVTYWSEQVAK